MELKISEILERFPLRVSITDYCNLKCFFCSNEGMALEQKNISHMDIDNFRYLLEILSKNGLRQISVTGGEPTLHPQVKEILKIINNSKIKEKFFHTNGTNLEEPLKSGELDKFTKIAVSIPALDYKIWNKINQGTQEQFNSLIKNLELLNKRGLSNKVEIKHVPLKGLNDSDELLKKTLDLCVRYRFKFKFLNFEPIKDNQEDFVIHVDKLSERLERLGCKRSDNNKIFRGQQDYLPIKRYDYQDLTGSLIEIGCGESNVCKACYKSNEIFLTPLFEIKPCHVHIHKIPLLNLIKEKNEKEILDKIAESRAFLKGRPGEDAAYWNQNQDEN